MYSTLESGENRAASGLKRLARRDLPTTPRVPARKAAQAATAKAPLLPIAWPELSIGNGLVWLRGGIKWIAILAMLGAGAGLGYAMIAPPKYTAYTDLIIDPSDLQVVNDDLYKSANDQNAQLLDVESKLRVLTSGNVLRRVVTELNLTADPEFAENGASSLPFVGGGADPLAGDPVDTAVGILDKKVSAWREERSYVVTVGVSSEKADKSVKIANAIVVAFQAELAQQAADGATRTATALTARVSELQRGVADAETAVEAFKSAHGLQETNGELLNSQSVTQLTKSAVDAQAGLIAAQSHYSELTDPLTGKANADAVQTPTMVALRTEYSKLKQEADAAATLYGPLHPTRASAERQLAGLQAQITAEANRAVQAAKLDLDTATRTVAQLNQQSADARSTVSTDDAAQVTLNNLVREAKAKSDVYEAFLTRAREVTERQQLDTTNVRIISPATPPSARSWPPRGFVVAGIGGFGGLALGLALALGLGWLGEFRRLRKEA